jgi:hypothetical protein
VVSLPYARFYDGWTYVTSIDAADISGDGIPDLVLAHTRGADDRHPDEPLGTGRYVQVLVSRSTGEYVDETDLRMGDQSATAPARHPVYGLNANEVQDIRLMDVNGDGHRDLFMAGSAGYIGSHAPLIHLNDGRGVFRVVDPDVITRGALFFGETASPISMNADAVVDFSHLDLLPGPDGRYGTGDEVTRVIPTLSVGR